MYVRRRPALVRGGNRSCAANSRPSIRNYTQVEKYWNMCTRRNHLQGTYPYNTIARACATNLVLRADTFRRHLTSPAQMRQVDFSNYVIRNFAEALCPIILGMLWIQFWAFLMFCARQNWGSDIPYTLPTSTTPRTDQTEAAKNNAQHKSTNIKHDVLRICIILCPRISHTSYGANYLHCRFLRRQLAKLI